MARKVQLLSIVLLLPLHSVCAAQDVSLASCHEKIAAAPGLAVLANKGALGTGKNTTPQMISDTALANTKELPFIAKWATAAHKSPQA